ncbi:hypothetical protein E5355_02630 [Bacteroides muris (ex Afrizal et al. 2022)]|uniref:Uncharacterized protein n=1 Tax=Bacteroides muris (ex Afrizal et al. 2022) TaxID=2516960 RepID=A0A4S2B4T7_9BACE|nr:hypothetical protein E5355_02630 [Bacteroides muris (ex Afrizal et al. 2022)]
MCDEVTDCNSIAFYCKTTALILQCHCKQLCSVAATGMQCDCNCFAVLLQHVCSDAAKGMQ